jgi:hypothetical protein
MAAPSLLLWRRRPTGRPPAARIRPPPLPLRGFRRSRAPPLVSESKNNLSFALLMNLLGSDFDSIFHRPRSSSGGVSPPMVVPSRVAVVVLQASILYDLLHHGARSLSRAAASAALTVPSSSSSLK